MYRNVYRNGVLTREPIKGPIKKRGRSAPQSDKSSRTAAEWACDRDHRFQGPAKSCPECGSEVVFGPRPERQSSSKSSAGTVTVYTLHSVKEQSVERLDTRIPGLNRVLGGGLAKHSIVLVAGEPGSGKSSICLKAAANLANSGMPVLYASAEQQAAEVAEHARRMGATSSSLHLIGTQNAEEVIAAARAVKAAVVVVDSINTFYDPSATDGEMAQIKAVAARMRDAAKADRGGFAAFFVGHFTKDDGIAGPRSLEHLVDAVTVYSVTPQGRRSLASGKNRYGRSGVVSLFDMTAEGLVEVRANEGVVTAGAKTSGASIYLSSALAQPMPVVVEARIGAQAIVPNGVQLPVGERRILGLDGGRSGMLLSILREECGVDLAGRDLFVEASGALWQGGTEAAIDLAAAVAVVSAHRRLEFQGAVAAFGSIGVSGAVKAADRIHDRINEAISLGCSFALVPAANKERLPGGLHVEHVEHARQIPAALELLTKARGRRL